MQRGCVDGDDVSTLLLDPRLSRAKGSLASSYIVGMTSTFLPVCCNSELCPLAAAKDAIDAVTRDPRLDWADPDDLEAGLPLGDPFFEEEEFEEDEEEDGDQGGEDEDGEDED